VRFLYESMDPLALKWAAGFKDGQQYTID
jgi:hypothetical protein